MRIIYSCLTIAIALTGTQQCTAQYGTFGEATCPEDSAAVDDIIYYGELLDMSGGYSAGDTVFDFTVYDFDGNPLNLYTELSGEKPVVLINGSVSCLRFRGTFEPDNNGQQYLAARNYLEDHINDYNWIFIYGVEAHPTDGNCPSNCPPTVSNDTTVVQPPFYGDRRYAVRGWEDSPEHDFPFTMYADNPNNAVYNNFFQRPFGIVAINCDGTVALRGDWVNSFFMDATNVAALNEWRTESNTCAIDWTPDEESDDEGTDDDGTDDDGTDDNGTDDEGTDDDGTDDDGTDDDGTDDEGTDDTPLYDGPTLAITSGGIDNEVVSNGMIAAPSALKIYPNPARDLLVIEGLEYAARILLVDISGRTLLDIQSADETLRFDASRFNPGPYILIVHEESKEPQRTAVIIQ